MAAAVFVLVDAVLDGAVGEVGPVVSDAGAVDELLMNRSALEQAPADLAYHAEGTGVLFARSAWDKSASWMDTVAGIYDQSHAHHDQGSFAWVAASN